MSEILCYKCVRPALALAVRTFTEHPHHHTDTMQAALTRSLAAVRPSGRVSLDSALCSPPVATAPVLLVMLVQHTRRRLLVAMAVWAREGLGAIVLRWRYG